MPTIAPVSAYSTAEGVAKVSTENAAPNSVKTLAALDEQEREVAKAASEHEAKLATWKALVAACETKRRKIRIKK